MNSRSTKTSAFCADLRMMLRRLPRYTYFPFWFLYKIRNVKGMEPRTVVPDHRDTRDVLAVKEQLLQDILESASGKAFLEIGIGELPNIQRVQKMIDRHIHYTACDFKSVCDSHKKELKLRKIDTARIRFAPNAVGTYSWTLFEMVRRRETYDVIYLDGHHTFYVDLPALFLSHFLLKPGGYILVDDILWTLDFLKVVMLRSFDEWYYYRKIYKFSDYEPEQRNIPHIKLMTEALLIEKLGYSKIDRYSILEWWTFQKPQ